MKRIFVVDDEADINLTINTALEENGFEVNAYDDPVIALDNFRKGALTWTKDLFEVKQIVEKYAETKFNSCLLNLYHNGNEGMGWHSDDEKSLGKNNTITSLSFGAERKFSFKHKLNKQYHLYFNMAVCL